MPKQKTKSSAKKRFKVTGTGKIRFKGANGRHLLTDKNSRRKRRVSKVKSASGADLREIRWMLGIGLH